MCTYVRDAHSKGTFFSLRLSLRKHILRLGEIWQRVLPFILAMLISFLQRSSGPKNSVNFSGRLLLDGLTSCIEASSWFANTACSVAAGL